MVHNIVKLESMVNTCTIVKNDSNKNEMFYPYLLEYCKSVLVKLVNNNTVILFNCAVTKLKDEKVFYNLQELHAFLGKLNQDEMLVRIWVCHKLPIQLVFGKVILQTWPCEWVVYK